MERLLIANRGEIAVRVARTATEMGIATVGVFSQDDAEALHTRTVDEAVPLPAAGPAAYLDGERLLAVARTHGCDAVHPGYGFLSERADFAARCADAGLAFVGPDPETLRLFGDKAQARAMARDLGLPVLPGTDGPTPLDEARDFLAGLGPGGAVLVKAVAGGGGRGIRPARTDEELAEAYERCASEALAAFGDAALYVEQLVPRARHVEVQVLGDGTDVVHLWDRECSLQRQRQKLVEVAPAEAVGAEVRERLHGAAVALCGAVRYRGLCTVEFLVAEDGGGGGGGGGGGDGTAPAGGPGDGTAVFIEANPRLQVEHTVTEAVTGLDLVRLQLEVAGGAALDGLGLTQDRVPAPRGVAVQARVNLEVLGADGSVRPAAGTLTAFDLPSGPGVRVDTFGYAGYRTNARFDSLLAKVVASVGPGAGGLPAALARAHRALSELRVEGVPTSVPFLLNLLRHPDVVAGRVHTRFVEEHLAELVEGDGRHRRRYVEPPAAAAGAGPTAARRAGAVVDSADPLAVLAYGREEAAREAGGRAGGMPPGGPDGTTPLLAPMQGTVVSLVAAEGDQVRAGQPLVVMEAMKMEHVVTAERGGVVRALAVAAGDTVLEGEPLAFLEEADLEGGADAGEEQVDLDEIRPDLAEVLERHRRTLDEARPEAVARRRRTGQRTVRENIDDLFDPGTFTEYGPLTVAARRRRNTVEELIAQTPADGLVMGLGQVNGHVFPEERARCAALAYDYTVLAGTQGTHNHEKLDRMAEVAARWRVPTVAFTEGGGGRPGDTERRSGFTRGFALWAQLSGTVPLVGVTSGRCFAGNAAILGCCDVIIATKGSAMGMGGPAMVEGGGLGVFRPEEIGPVDVMEANGTIDVLVDDEAAAVAAAKQYLSYFQGRLPEWACADQRLLRRAVPENRVRAYDVRRVIELIADSGSVLELRPRFGKAMITALVRVEGRTLGLIANNPQHLGGAIDADAADKAARLMQVCEAFDLPVLSLVDTPGNMVGPEAEKAGLIRHCSRMFVVGANLTVPIFTVVLRKAYGLGAIAMAGASYGVPMLCVSWPTGEFGGMGLEGAVKLGYRNELAAIADPAERRARYEAMVAAAYAEGKAVVRGEYTSLDDVIDPVDTRRWLVAGLRSLPPVPPREGGKLRWVDAW